MAENEEVSFDNVLNSQQRTQIIVQFTETFHMYVDYK